ncbi:MAG: hypothetical protein QM778_26685 [Myxococcales bacterium]
MISADPRALRAPIRTPLTLGAALSTALLASACGDDPEAPGKATELPSPLVITADWLHGTLSYASLSGLEGTQTHAEAVVSTLDLSKYVPGPLTLEFTPDRKKLLVATSSGFFAIGGAGGLLINEPNIPSGPGKFLMVDVDAQEVEHELDTGEGPNGIAVTPDGKRAFVAHFGSGNMAVVDLETFQIVQNLDIGIYAEEVVLDETGTVGVVGYSDDGSVRTFGVADPAGTLSPQVKLVGDSAGIAFFPGTKTAFVVQAPNPLGILSGSASSGHTLLDVTNPAAPVVLEDVREPAIVGAYPAVVAANRGTVIVPAAQDGNFGVREYALENNKAVLKQEVPAGSAQFLGALGFAYDGKDTVVMAVPGQRAVIVTNLDTKQSRSIDWEQDEAGPADVVIR